MRALQAGLMYSQCPSHLVPAAKHTSSFLALPNALNVPQQLYTCQTASLSVN